MVLHPDGNISLMTTGLGRIDLGGEPALLNTQIETIVHLNKTLPTAPAPGPAEQP